MADCRRGRPPVGAWRWEWAHSPTADEVPPWMRVGPGDSGALHRTVVHLVRQRESVGAHADWAYRPLSEIAAEAVAWPDAEADAHEVLGELEAFGAVEQRRASSESSEPAWRATCLAVTAINQAYRSRHPLTTDQDA